MDNDEELNIKDRINRKVRRLVQDVVDEVILLEEVSRDGACGIARERAGEVYDQEVGCPLGCSLEQAREKSERVNCVLGFCGNRGVDFDFTWQDLEDFYDQGVKPWQVPVYAARCGLMEWAENQVMQALECADEFDEDAFIENVKDYDQGPPTEGGVKWAKARAHDGNDVSLCRKVVDRSMTTDPDEDATFTCSQCGSQRVEEVTDVIERETRYYVNGEVAEVKSAGPTEEVGVNEMRCPRCGNNWKVDTGMRVVPAEDIDRIADYAREHWEGRSPLPEDDDEQAIETFFW